MNQTERISSGQTTNYRGPLLEKDHGYFASASVTLMPEDIYQFCQNREHVVKVLADFPGGLEDKIDLSLETAENKADTYRVVFKTTEHSTVTGKLTFLINSAPLRRGSVISCDANFSSFKWGEDSPSSLINLFLKRMKALMETGEIPTTRGQPSGREEIKTFH